MTKHKSKKTKEFYKVADGKLGRTERICDRCGSGTFMAEHKDRFYCGKCAMTIWKKKEENVKSLV